MIGFWVVLAWIASMLLGTYLGYERGRWETGLVLGLVFGPLGALAAGMIQPSFEHEAERRYMLEKHMRQVHRAENERTRQKQAEARTLSDMISALEEQIEGQQNPLAEGFENLATRLEEIARRDPSQELALRSWIAWLKEKSDAARAGQLNARDVA